MDCPKCQHENSDENKFCSHCGFDFSQKNIQPKKSRKFLYIFLIITSLLIGGGYLFDYFDTQAKNEINKERNYANQFNSNLTLMVNTIEGLNYICRANYSAWRSSIYDNSGYGRNQFALEQQLENNKEVIEKFMELKKIIDLTMVLLKSPPKNWENSHKLLLDAYASYSELYNLATNPNGTFNNYGTAITNKYSAFQKTVLIL